MTYSDKEELVSFSVAKGLMSIQENAFHSMLEVMFNRLREDIREDITEVIKDVVELQKSLEFSKKDVL